MMSRIHGYQHNSALVKDLGKDFENQLTKQLTKLATSFITMLCLFIVTP